MFSWQIIIIKIVITKDKTLLGDFNLDWPMQGDPQIMPYGTASMILMLHLMSLDSLS